MENKKELVSIRMQMMSSSLACGKMVKELNGFPKKLNKEVPFLVSLTLSFSTGAFSVNLLSFFFCGEDIF
jgi:hypothetical protein